ncbi:MAG: hypothetical protein ACLUHE_05395 [Christensenellales bacterium]
MVTTGGANTHVIAVNGNFDDAQTGVKRIFADRAFAETMAAQGRVLSSANSINFGRLVPQVVLLFLRLHAVLLKAGAIKPGDEVNFCACRRATSATFWRRITRARPVCRWAG